MKRAGLTPKRLREIGDLLMAGCPTSRKGLSISPYYAGVETAAVELFGEVRRLRRLRIGRALKKARQRA